MFDLLQDPILPVAGNGPEGASLPGVLARLSAGEDLGFPGLTAYQRQGWFCFLVQLAAQALAAADETEIPETADEWRGLVAALAGPDADTAFSLIAPADRPAFLQPPVRDPAALARFKGPEMASDAIDLLNTARNHDVKSKKIRNCQPYHWIYSLINLQTRQGYFGKGKYGIARMNGGDSARVFADRRGGHDWATRFRRDLRLLLATRDKLLTDRPYYRERDGIGLVWLETWDQESAIPVERLDPYFIEICRRIRLIQHNGAIGVLQRSTETTRIAAADFKGNLGDPWAPIDSVAGMAVTIPAAGFDYQRVVKILTDRKGLPVALRPAADGSEDNLDLEFSVLVRGQGRTDGLHQRIVSIPRALADGLEDEDTSECLTKRADQMRKDVADALGALRLGLRIYVQGAPADLKPDDDRPRAQAEGLSREIDDHFLPHLWDQALIRHDGPIQAWHAWLRYRATHWFEAGLEALPPPVDRREKALIKATNVFHSKLNKALPPEEKSA